MEECRGLWLSTAPAHPDRIHYPKPKHPKEKPASRGWPLTWLQQSRWMGVEPSKESVVASKVVIRLASNEAILWTCLPHNFAGAIEPLQIWTYATASDHPTMPPFAWWSLRITFWMFAYPCSYHLRGPALPPPKRQEPQSAEFRPCVLKQESRRQQTIRAHDKVTLCGASWLLQMTRGGGRPSRLAIPQIKARRFSGWRTLRIAGTKSWTGHW